MPYDYTIGEIETGIKSSDKNLLVCYGQWIHYNIPIISKQSKRFRRFKNTSLIIDGSQISEFDSAGAIWIFEFISALKRRNNKITLDGFKPEHLALLDLVEKEKNQIHKPIAIKKGPNFFEIVGRETVIKYKQFKEYFTFIGEVVVSGYRSLLRPKEIQWRGLLNAIEEMGYYTLPIIALLSFLIGVVLAYQLGVQLENYGANAFIVNLIGAAIFREFGPLITAIIAAGRTTSAITAQIGTMKINEELDALQTMGITPIELLVVPKVLGSLIVLPLLMVWADFFGVLGGMMMTKYLYGMNYGDFIGKFKDAIDLNTLMVGLSKAPVFALIISGVGCFQGLNVSLSADSIGHQTTKSVVQALFLIIVADAIYSIIYSHLNI